MNEKFYEQFDTLRYNGENSALLKIGIKCFSANERKALLSVLFMVDELKWNSGGREFNDYHGESCVVYVGYYYVKRAEGKFVIYQTAGEKSEFKGTMMTAREFFKLRNIDYNNIMSLASV